MSEINVLSLSYGKDSLATIAACEQLGIPIHRIIHAEVWATDEISADLPPMVEFKKKADAIIKERWGLEVEHICAMTTPDKKYGLFSRCPSDGRGKQTYEKLFYTKLGKGQFVGTIKGFPMVKGGWCHQLKTFSDTPQQQGAETNTVVSLLGIAADEPERIERHMKKPNVRLPLVEIGWTEADCRKWCEENDLLSPIYTTATRGGCWFCHNQGVGQLRLLRKNYPDLWALLMKWDLDSPVTFRPDGHTVHDFDERFRLEEEKAVPMDGTFKWRMIDDYHAFPAVQMDWDDYFKEIGDDSADN